jgi:predicted nuclease of predicted toxin-antitoxin system
MRFLVDAQLPPALARLLESHGHEACAVREVGLREADDAAIWDFASRDGWIIVTKDEDFPERSLKSQSAPQIVWLRIGNSTKRTLLAWLAPLLPRVIRELADGNRIVEVRE